MNPAIVAHNLTKVVAICTKLLHGGVVSLSVFGGNFVLAKVHEGSSVSVVRS